jgi:hypothetical protein
MIQRSARPKKQLLQRRASLAPLLEMLLDSNAIPALVKIHMIANDRKNMPAT